MKKLTQYKYDLNDLMSIKDFKECCRTGSFNDCDGNGYAVIGDQVDNTTYIYPSDALFIREDATHVL